MITKTVRILGTLIGVTLGIYLFSKFAPTILASTDSSVGATLVRYGYSIMGGALFGLILIIF